VLPFKPLSLAQAGWYESQFVEVGVMEIGQVTFSTHSSANHPGVPACSRLLTCHLRHKPDWMQLPKSSCSFWLPPLCLEVTDSIFLSKRENLEDKGSGSYPALNMQATNCKCSSEMSFHRLLKGGGNSLSSLYPCFPYHMQFRLMLL